MKNKIYLFLLLVTTLGCGKFSFQDVADQSIAIPKPSIRSVTSTSVTINLDSNAIAKAYEVGWNETEGIAGYHSVYIGSSHAPVTITGLTPGKTYYFFERVESTESGDWSLWGKTYGTTSAGSVSTKKTLVVCLGTSLTQGALVAAGNGYPEQMQTTLGSAYKVVNLGVGGATVVAVQNQIPTAIALIDTSLYSKEIAIIEDGTNDFDNLVPASTIVSYTASTHAQLQAAGFKTIAVTSTANNSITNTLNGDPIPPEDIRQTYSATVRATFITNMHAKGLADLALDTHIGILKGIGIADYTYYNADGCHLTIAGYGLMAAKIAPAVISVASGGTYGSESQPQTVVISSLSLSDGTLSPTFATGTINYTASTTQSSITVSTTGASVYPSGPVSLIDGDNNIFIQANNGVNQKSYRIKVTKTGSVATDLGFGQFSNCTLSGGVLTSSAVHGGATGTTTLNPGGYVKMQVNATYSNSNGVVLAIDSLNNANYNWTNVNLLSIAYVNGSFVAQGKGSSASNKSGAVNSMWIKTQRSLDGRTLTSYVSNDDINYSSIGVNANVCSATVALNVKIVFTVLSGASCSNFKIYNP